MEENSVVIQTYKHLLWWPCDKTLSSVRNLGLGKYTWCPGMDFEAVCEKNHVPPENRCSCGIYSMAELPVLEKLHGTHRSGDVSMLQVTTLLLIYGKVIKHEHGYRSQFARIEGLFYPQCAMCGNVATLDITGKSKIRKGRTIRRYVCARCKPPEEIEYRSKETGEPYTVKLVAKKIDFGVYEMISTRYKVPLLKAAAWACPRKLVELPADVPTRWWCDFDGNSCGARCTISPHLSEEQKVDLLHRINAAEGAAAAEHLKERWS